MLLRIMSDLHSEFWDFHTKKNIRNIIPEFPNDQKTILIIAGDIGLHIYDNFEEILNILSQRFYKIFIVLGNHYFYNGTIFDQIDNILEEWNKKTDNVIFMENTFITIDGVNFIGANLWTNFNNRNPIDILAAKNQMNDYHVIFKSDGSRLTPEETVDIFDVSKKFIFEKIKKDQKNVVITHHGCSLMSCKGKYNSHSLNPAYCTELSPEILEHEPDLWIHGHTHTSHDYYIGKTRVICNPFGYKGYEENPDFQNNLIIEI